MNGPEYYIWKGAVSEGQLIYCSGSHKFVEFNILLPYANTVNVKSVSS